jgi:broad specificity phosphatase PhoE
MLKVIIVQPGATDFDEQRRIKGSLDLPLTPNGTNQVERTVVELAKANIDYVYSAPCRSAQQTAQAIAERRHLRVKTVDTLRNLDHGLWHGKLIDEVKRQQPRVYRQGQEHPESVCPPEGESWTSARDRVTSTLSKILRKHKDGVLALVIPEPLATMVCSLLRHTEPGDLWKSECDGCHWEPIEIEGAVVH